MRSKQRDQTGFVTFSGKFYINVSNSGVASNGMPFIVQRTGLGQYTLRFSTAFVVIAATVGSDAGYGLAYAPGVGCFSINSFNTAAALVDASLLFTATARKVIQ